MEGSDSRREKYSSSLGCISLRLDTLSFSSFGIACGLFAIGNGIALKACIMLLDTNKKRFVINGFRIER